jgi:hypothetical protein
MFSVNINPNKLNTLFKLFKTLISKTFSIVKPGFWGTHYVKYLLNSLKLNAGLFDGMHYVNQSVCGSIIPKYLGTYEVELKPIFKELLKISFKSIIDVGAAEGYYAVGCALKFPHAQVIAYEATEEGRLLLKEVINSNGVADRVQICGICTPELLLNDVKLYNNEENLLLIMDVEGAEEYILSLCTATDLKNFHILIELHDWVDEKMGDRIIDKFSATHLSQLILARKRIASDFQAPEFWILRKFLLPSLLAFSYERPLPMRWLYLEPKQSF